VRGCHHAVFPGSRSFRWYKGLGLILRVMKRWRAIAYVAILQMLRQVLWPVIVEGGRVLHEGHGVGRLIVDAISIVAVWEWMGVVEPTGHTHIDLALLQPIWMGMYSSASCPVRSTPKSIHLRG